MFYLPEFDLEALIWLVYCQLWKSVSNYFMSRDVVPGHHLVFPVFVLLEVFTCLDWMVQLNSTSLFMTQNVLSSPNFSIHHQTVPFGPWQLSFARNFSRDSENTQNSSQKTVHTLHRTSSNLSYFLILSILSYLGFTTGSTDTQLHLYFSIRIFINLVYNQRKGRLSLSLSLVEWAGVSEPWSWHSVLKWNVPSP